MVVRTLGLAVLLACFGCGGGGVGSNEGGTREIAFQSAPVDEVPIALSTQDLQGRTDGVTNFVRVYPSNAVVRVAAPETFHGLPFYRWVWDGGSADAQVFSVPTDRVSGLTAVYGDGCTFEPNYTNDLDRLLHWQRMPVKIYLAIDGNATQGAIEAARTGFGWWNGRLGGVVRCPRLRVRTSSFDGGTTSAGISSATPSTHTRFRRAGCCRQRSSFGPGWKDKMERPSRHTNSATPSGLVGTAASTQT